MSTTGRATRSLKKGRQAGEDSITRLREFAESLKEEKKRAESAAAGQSSDFQKVSPSELQGIANMKLHKRRRPESLCLCFRSSFSPTVGSNMGTLVITDESSRTRPIEDVCWVHLRTGARALRFLGADRQGGCRLELEAWRDDRHMPSSDPLRRRLEDGLQVYASPILLQFDVRTTENRYVHERVSECVRVGLHGRMRMPHLPRVLA